MISQQPLVRFEKQLFAGFLLLLIFSFFYQLGIYPLFLEEPRRGLIALEMIFQDNLWVPTQTGDLYFRKPPVYNWVLIASYKLFGDYSEFATRFFSVFSHLLLSLITFLFTRKYLDHLTAIFVAMSLLVAADILVYFSTLGEIDLFYALLTAIPIFATYHYGQRGQYWKLFIVVYLFTAIGFLTKGLTSLPYTAITLLVYFIQKREFKQLFRLPHFIGIALLVVLVGGYFYVYSQYQDVSGWWTTLFAESADKATSGGILKWLKHILLFPIETIKNIMPAGLLVPLLFSKAIKVKLKEHPVVWYCVLVFVFNFLVYWLSIEAKSRYIYPLFPFMIIPLIYMALQSKALLWKKVLRVLAIVFISVLILLPVVGFFSNQLDIVPNLNLIYGVILALSLGLGFVYWRQKARPYLLILGVMVVLKFGLSAIIPATRALDSGAARDKALGIEIVALTEGKSLKRFGNVRMSLGIVFYVERGRQEPLYQTTSTDEDYYFIYPSDMVSFTGNVEIIKRFNYWEDEILLIKNF